MLNTLTFNLERSSSFVYLDRHGAQLSGSKILKADEQKVIESSDAHR